MRAVSAVQRQVNAAPPRNDASSVDSGLHCLALCFSLNGSAFDIERARREYLVPGLKAKLDDLVRIARAEGYKARKTFSSMTRFDAVPHGRATAPVPQRGMAARSNQQMTNVQRQMSNNQGLLEVAVSGF